MVPSDMTPVVVSWTADPAVTAAWPGLIMIATSAAARPQAASALIPAAMR